MNYKSLAPGVITFLTLTSTLLRGASSATTYVPATMEPPAIRREFRGAWIATVENIDWPSRPGLPVEQQKAELLTMLDRAVKLNLNAVILQVRPACDALYASRFEPWAYYISGVMGRPPAPFYDPLEFAVAEAHKRGLELHAWFNPYRAGFLGSKIQLSANHISKTHPEMVVAYGKHLWLDPGQKAVQDYSLRVVMDVVKRYDIDGVHFDDYFYPYTEQDAHKKNIEFPDSSSWQKYSAHGKLSRDDWRRENVNAFVQRVHDSIKATKPWVKFGVSPFGIWQPGYPHQIKGMNAYNELYCDSRKWLAEGWLDYCAPQLYWAIDPPDQSYPVLLKWWLENNPKHRNIWPGLDSERVGGKWKPDEIVNQIKITRQQDEPAGGEVHWSIKCLMADKGGLATTLAGGVYSDPALIPSSPWLDKKAPSKPKLKIQENGQLSWKPSNFEKVSLWLLQTRFENQWHTSILPGDAHDKLLDNLPELVSLIAIDRCGVASQPTVLRRELQPAK